MFLMILFLMKFSYICLPYGAFELNSHQCKHLEACLALDRLLLVLPVFRVRKCCKIITFFFTEQDIEYFVYVKFRRNALAKCHR